jgi:hypothetical protein
LAAGFGGLHIVFGRDYRKRRYVAKQSALKQNSDETRSKWATSGSTKPRESRSSTALDRLIHERLRLGIVSALAANESLDVQRSEGLVNTTDGNLSVHAMKTEDAGYITCSKSFDGDYLKRNIS